MRYAFILSLLLVLASCTSQQTKRFCLNSGYAEDSYGYDSCVSRNETYQEEIRYCMDHYYIDKEGDETQQCFAEARSMRNQYRADYNVCNAEAKRKYPRGQTRAIPPKEKYIYNEAGQLVEKVTVTTEEIPAHELNTSRNAVGLDCMRNKGWSTFGSHGWNSQKKRD